jgi:hypothetical protein
MKYWVKIKFDYSGDVYRNHAQEIKTNHYFRENDDGTVLHVNAPVCINQLNRMDREDVLKDVPKEEFDKVLKDTIDYLKINITTHKFIKDA